MTVPDNLPPAFIILLFFPGLNPFFDFRFDSVPQKPPRSLSQNFG